LAFGNLVGMGCPMRLILVRHGESEWNREGRVMGRADVALTELGRRQACAVAEALRVERIHAVYSSPLSRALETGEAIMHGRCCPLVPSSALQELSRGSLEGLTREEALGFYPDLQREWLHPERGSEDYGGESLVSLGLRVRECLGRIRRRHRQGTVVVVGHYFVNLMVILDALRMEPSKFRCFDQDLGAISVVDIEKGRSILRLLNDTCHLPKG